MIGGVFQIIALFDARGVGNKILLGLFGALSVFIGIVLFGNPLEGVLTLTLQRRKPVDKTVTLNIQ